MHPFLLELGRFRIPTYGVIALCALGIAMLLVRRYARIEGLDPSRTAEAIVLTIAVGFFGARLFEAVINWDRYFGRPGGPKLLLFSTGVFFGGLITAIPFCIYWFRHIGLPVLQGLDLLALTGCVAEGVGRWGCFCSGCCFGTPTGLPWAVTFPEIARRLHSGLPSVPIHPTQIYMSLNSLLILGVLLLLYRKKRFHGRIIAVYVLLYSVTRFFIELIRGDADRGFVFGTRMSTSQFLAIVLAVAAGAAYLALDARHRRSNDPDWRSAVTLRRGAQAFIIAALLAAPFAGASAAPAFAVRMVKLVGDPADPATVAHVRFCRELGFNALWVYSHQAGVWTKDRAPQEPALDPDFLRLARWCRRRGMDLTVSINPVADTRDRFVFTDPDGERRLLAFVSMLRKQAGVRRFVLSFDDQPTELHELSDIFRYGAGSAPAHLELTRRVASALPEDVALWMCAAAYCDAHLGQGAGPYAKAFLAGLPTLPLSIGIVWTGPTVLSPTITRADLEATRARLGGRPLLLYDNFPATDNDENDALALMLGALRGRDPGIRDVVAAYLACPLFPLAGSRLWLATSAEFLRDPPAYDPDAAVRKAIASLAGADHDASVALETQQMEWGGTIAGRNYWPSGFLNPSIAAGRLHDPAFVDSFTWTVARYPGRMSALAGLDDAAFRDDLLRMMRRRLAIAQAMPLTIEYLERIRLGKADAAEVLARIAGLRRSFAGDLDARRVLDLFLDAAAVPRQETRP